MLLGSDGKDRVMPGSGSLKSLESRALSHWIPAFAGMTASFPAGLLGLGYWPTLLVPVVPVPEQLVSFEDEDDDEVSSSLSTNPPVRICAHSFLGGGVRS